MPNCTSQIVFCNLPINFDTYSGCSHGCVYCFAVKKKQKVVKKEGALKLENFINGKRTNRTNWCDWDIPLHWGGMSDPFQPVEKKYKNSLECLNVFAKKKYPFVFSTKGSLVVDKEYLSLLKNCNVVAQVSLISPQYDRYEKGAPPYADRLKIIKKLSEVCERVIVRIQPYIVSAYSFLITEGLKDFRKNGAYGVIVEGIKLNKKKKGFVSIGRDYCYEVNTLKKDFTMLKEKAHDAGLHFFVGENRLRAMGDSLTCCGCEGVEGFKINKANLNYIYFAKNEKKNIYTKKMLKDNTGGCFAAIVQKWDIGQILFKTSYKSLMERAAKTKTYRKVMGLRV